MIVNETSTVYIKKEVVLNSLLRFVNILKKRFNVDEKSFKF